MKRGTDLGKRFQNLMVVVPAYNVGEYIGKVIEKLREYLDDGKIIVVDDGSSDNTALVAAEAKVIVLKHPKNRGKGAALKTGIEYCKKVQTQSIMTIDADLQHSPEHLPEFVELLNNQNFDIVIGNRLSDLKTMPYDRRFSNLTTSNLLSLITGRKILDSQCGYRLIKNNAFQALERFSDNYEFETECLLHWCINKYKIGFTPIATNYSGAPSSIHRLKDTSRFIKVVLKYLINRKSFI